MRTRITVVLGLAVVAVVAVAGSALARPAPVHAQTVVCDPATVHCYEVVTSPVRWPAAKAAAEAMTFNGTQGHLATITSQAETSFLVSQGLAPSFYWIGASQPAGENCPSCGWAWVTGEPFVYTNWAALEPNDFYGPASEQFLEFWVTPGTWNDQCDCVQPGFVVEYEAPTNMDQCKQGGWQAYGVFENQGDCVSFVASGGKNEPGRNVP
jgi:hypothetical protein